MTPFQIRMSAAAARALQRFGTLAFKWKADGTEYSGLMGERDVSKRERKTAKLLTFEVLKSVMAETPVVGRELTFVDGGDKWEVLSFTDDEISWSIRLALPKTP